MSGAKKEIRDGTAADSRVSRVRGGEVSAIAERQGDISWSQ
jgi:hypothetical protein